MELFEIKGLGPKSLAVLKDNNIQTAEELLFSFPKAYEAYEIEPDLLFSGEYTYLNVTILTTPAFIKLRGNTNTIVFYFDAYGNRIKGVYFSSDYLRYKLFKNTRLHIYGRYSKLKKEFVIRKIFFDNLEAKVVVDYKLKGIKNNLIQKAIKTLFENNINLIESLPNEIITKYKLYPIDKFIYTSHFPSNKEEVKQVIRRRKYEEFFWYAIRLELIKRMRTVNTKPKRIIKENIVSSFLDSLPYELTEGQLLSMKDIRNDIESDKIMNRIIQGDVGCGKSIVSIYAIILAVSAGYQTAVMVPTEVLANQQYELILSYLGRLGYTVELLTSSTKNKDKEDILYRLINNRVSVIVGTHALIEDNVIFNRLGLIVIDEQHKFGVKQRQKLINKFNNVDCLYLSATPIPRTLGLTAFGDLDITSIKTLPKGRLTPTTMVLGYNRIKGLFKSINKQIKEGRSIYVVVPLVNENEEYDAIDINSCYNMFSEGLPDAKIEMVHGKMKSLDKNNKIAQFKSGNVNVLISTTVIEVGVDVPNATVMVIMDAHLFGLAQIHQLRGRVGRGNYQSYCILVSDDTTNPRLLALERMSSGFDIAEEDLRLRGPGDYLGNMQSGYQSFEYVDFEADIKIWNVAKLDALKYIDLFYSKKVASHTFNEILADNKKKLGKIN